MKEMELKFGAGEINCMQKPPCGAGARAQYLAGRIYFMCSAARRLAPGGGHAQLISNFRLGSYIGRALGVVEKVVLVCAAALQALVVLGRLLHAVRRVRQAAASVPKRLRKIWPARRIVPSGSWRRAPLRQSGWGYCRTRPRPCACDRGARAPGGRGRGTCRSAPASGAPS